jgi:hypothetical protein
MFQITFEDCGIAYPDGSEIGSFDGTAYYENDSGMPILLDIELRRHHPEAPIEKAFSKKMLSRFDPHELWMLNGLAVSIKRQHADRINQAMEEEREERRAPRPFSYQSTISAGRTM